MSSGRGWCWKDATSSPGLLTPFPQSSRYVRRTSYRRLRPWRQSDRMGGAWFLHNCLGRALSAACWIHVNENSFPKSYVTWQSWQGQPGNIHKPYHLINHLAHCRVARAQVLKPEALRHPFCVPLRNHFVPLFPHSHSKHSSSFSFKGLWWRWGELISVKLLEQS